MNNEKLNNTPQHNEAPALNIEEIAEAMKARTTTETEVLATPNTSCLSNENTAPTEGELISALGYVPLPLPQKDTEYKEIVLQSIHSISESAVSNAYQWYTHGSAKSTESTIEKKFAKYGRGSSGVSPDVVFCLAKLNGFDTDRDTKHVETFVLQLLDRRNDPTAAIESDLLKNQAKQAQVDKEKESKTKTLERREERRQRLADERKAKVEAGRPSYLNYKSEDGGVMDCWIDSYGKHWRYAVGYDHWLQWSNTHWTRDKTNKANQSIIDLMDAMNDSAIKEISELKKEIEISGPMDEIDQEIKTMQAMVSATKRSIGRTKSVHDMSAMKLSIDSGLLDNGNYLNFPNGALDMDTLEFSENHDKEHLITYCLDYEYSPSAKCPRFERFLNEVLVLREQDDEGQWIPDTELVALFQELLGYSLTTDNSYEVMMWMSGDGGNGKSKIIDIITKLLGPSQTKNINFHSIGTQGDYSLGDIPGQRVIFSTESDKGKRINEGYLKRIVSGEMIDARMIYGSPFEFLSVSKVWWAMNDKPVITDTSDSIWRRMKLIPFYRQFTDAEKNEGLRNELLSEASGILNFAIEGLRRLRVNGKFTQSTASKEEIEQYRKEANPTQQWLEERTEIITEPTTSQAPIYADFKQWCADNGRMPPSSTNFGKEMKRLKVGWKRKTAGMHYAVKLLYTQQPISIM